MSGLEEFPQCNALLSFLKNAITMPFVDEPYACFFIVLSVEAATFTRIDVPSLSLMRILRRLGRDRFLVLLFAWLTL